MEEFKGSLGKYKIIITEDNTQTLWSEYFDENCHNTSGAISETIYNYIEGCEIENLSSLYNPIHLFDVGFGPGIGLKCLLAFDFPIKYYSIEIDRELVFWALRENFKLSNWQTLEMGDGISMVSFTIKNVEAYLFIGDARKSIPKAIEQKLILPLHAIFQDPFSPKKNPRLWTVEWFLLLKSISHPDVKLSTYSSSVSIRKSLIKAGFIIKNAKGFAKKRTMTKATLKGVIDPSLLLELERSPTLELIDNSIKI
jgi:hypothetical protein